MAKATWEGIVLAESDRTVVVDGNHYFPPESVHQEYLRPSNTTTVCGWKGTARYYDIEVNDRRNPDAAWYYPSPMPAAAGIEGRVAFWRGVRVEE